jgi:hypothetical protein
VEPLERYGAAVAFDVARALWLEWTHLLPLRYHTIKFQNMVPGLYDPLGFSKNRSEEAKAKGRVSEIKNGRLAMIGVAGLYAAATIPGSVPLQPDC